MARRLERALARFRRRQLATRQEDGRPTSPAAFRAAVEQRLRNLEQQLDELKGRVNGLIFLVVGTVLTQIVLKILQ